VNYNVRSSGAESFATTIADPNFAALEDRMLLRFHPMTRERFRAVEASAERLELGQLEFGLADRIRDHLTLVHAAAVHHPLVSGKLPSRPVRLAPELYTKLRQISEEGLAASPHPGFSPRLKSRAIKLAAAGALLRSLQRVQDGPLVIGAEETEFAERFYRAEIQVRKVRSGYQRPKAPAS
jgi:hypothetical protein